LVDFIAGQHCIYDARSFWTYFKLPLEARATQWIGKHAPYSSHVSAAWRVVVTTESGLPMAGIYN
jgi:hypothetical protein